MNGKNRLTEHAVAMITAAQQEAFRRRWRTVSTGHLLIGMLRVKECRAAEFLKKLELSLPEVRDQVEHSLAEGSEEIQHGFGVEGYTELARRVMSAALQESKRLGNELVGSEHILLAILRSGEGAAADVIEGLAEGNLEDLAEELTEMLEGGTLEAVGAHGGKRRRTPQLERFAQDLTKMAAEGKLDPVLGREEEITRAIQILSRRTKNNPLLIGEPGVGKTAVAEGLARAIAAREVPLRMQEKRVLALSLSSIVAGTKYRGEFEERMKNLIQEVKASGDVILFLDEIHTLIGAGGAEGTLDASNILKPCLSRGEIQVIGATTLAEHRKHFEKDAALSRRFQTVLVDEPTPAVAEEILMGLKERYEEFHSATIEDEAVRAAVKLSHRYITGRYLPDKAIDVMDEAASRVRIRTASPQMEGKSFDLEIESLVSAKNEAIEAQDYERAANLRDQEKALRQKMKEERENCLKREENHIMVTIRDIEDVVAQWTGIPVRALAAKESDKLMQMEKTLARRVIGQEKAVAAVSKAVRRARAGLKDPKRPIGSFLFLGPTGVGKTELVKSLAEALFGTEDAVIRFDMSEYMEKHTISRMVGAPPGYVGYEEGGQMTDAIRKKPYSIVLLDEIEKAHPDVFHILLQVLDDGRLTDGQGRTIDFKNTVIIMTSNVGANVLKESAQGMGFATREESKEERDKRVEKGIEAEVQRLFKPEFLNRLDERIVFHSLGKEELSKILDIMLRDVEGRLTEKGIKLSLAPSARDRLIEKGSDFKYGARPLKRTIEKLLVDELSERLLLRTFKSGDTVTVRAEKSGDGLEFQKKVPRLRRKEVANVAKE